MDRPRTRAQRDIFREWGGKVPPDTKRCTAPPAPRFEEDVLFITERGAYQSAAPPGAQ